jgi:four helix bundle protein
MESFRNLKVWEKAHALTLDIYQASRSFPKEELFGLTSQMRRASASVGANIAEGVCRKGDAEFSRFLYIAVGSASELEYHLLLARDLKVLRSTDYERLYGGVVEIKRMLTSLIRSVKN